MSDLDKLLRNFNGHLDRFEYTPVKTKFGILNDRGAIDLDEAVYTEPCSLSLYCQIQSNDGEVGSEPEFVQCIFRFNQVLDLKIYDGIDSAQGESSFDSFTHSSEYLSALSSEARQRLETKSCLGYQVLTYDTVIQVYCESFELEEYEEGSA